MTNYRISNSQGPPFIQIDIMDRCNLRCRTCIRGMGLMKNSPGLMPIDLFKKIVRKAKDEGYPAIAFTNWTEPFLCKDLNKYLYAVKENGLFCIVSSNLSLEPMSVQTTIKNALMAGPDRLFVSVSGYEQAVYEVNHVGGNISWVKENLDYIALLKREKTIDTDIVLKFICFDYNSDDEQLLSNYAKKLGLGFLKVEGSSHPSRSDAFAKDRTEDFYSNMLKNYRPSTAQQKNGEVCDLVMRDIPIDCRGDVYLCCALPNYQAFNFGPFLEMPFEEILFKRYVHPFCSACQLPRRKMTENELVMLADGLMSVSCQNAPEVRNNLYLRLKKLIGH